MIAKVFLLIGINIIFTILFAYFMKGNKQFRRRVFLIALSMGLFFFSGIGISRIDNYEIHAFRYSIFLLLALASYTLFSSKLRFTLGYSRRNIKSDDDMPGLFDKAVNSLPILSKWLFIIYFVSAVVPFVFPQFRLQVLFQPWRLITDQLVGGAIFSSRLARQSNVILSIASKFKLITFPFCLIEINRRYPGKAFRFMTFILLDMYLSIMSTSYWGRIQLIKPFFFYFAFLVIEKKVKLRKVILPAVLLVFAISILFNALFDWRLSGSFSLSQGLLYNVNRLFTQETNIPKYYDYIISIHKNEYIGTFLLWILNLFFPFFDFVEASFSTSRIFSESVLGISLGNAGFYVILPGWLGESYLIFGETLFFIGAIIAGAFLGLIFKIVEKNKYLSYYEIYLLWTLIFYLRNNTQEFIAQAFNPLVGVFAVYFIYAFCRTKYRS